MDNTKEEIDLISILIGIKNGIAGFFKWVYNATLQNLFVVILFSLIGASIGFSVFLVKKPIFISELTISHIRFTNDQCFELINNLTKLNGNDKLLSEMLKMDISLIQKVKSITYLPLSARTNKLYTDSASYVFPFKVSAEVYDPSVLDSLQSKIMNYLESNEYGIKRKQIDKVGIQKYIDKLAKEINDVDSLKKIVNQSILHKNTGNGIMIDEPIDPVKITQKGVELFDTQLKLEKQLAINESFELMMGFNGGVQLTADLTLSIASGVLYGYLFSLIFIFLRRKKA